MGVGWEPLRRWASLPAGVCVGLWLYLGRRKLRNHRPWDSLIHTDQIAYFTSLGKPWKNVTEMCSKLVFPRFTRVSYFWPITLRWVQAYFLARSHETGAAGADATLRIQGLCGPDLLGFPQDPELGMWSNRGGPIMGEGRQLLLWTEGARRKLQWTRERETLKMEDGYSQDPWEIFKDEHRLVLAERSLTRLLMLTEVNEED